MEDETDQEGEGKRLTPDQEAAVEAAKKILRGSFDTFVIGARAADDNLKDSIITDWHGPISDVLGLAMVAKARILHRATDSDTIEWEDK